MPKGPTTASDLLAKIFRNTALPWDAITDIYLSLHTADPTAGGSQTSSEATYTSYARIAVSRSAAGWDIVSNVASNDDLLQFPQCTGGTNTITHVAAGTLSSGAGQLLYVGPLNASLAVANLIRPQFDAGGLSITET